MTKKYADDWMAPFKAKPSSSPLRKRGRPSKPHVRAPSQWQSKAYRMEALDEAIRTGFPASRGKTLPGGRVIKCERDYIRFYLGVTTWNAFGADVVATYPRPARRVMDAEVRSVQQRLSRWRAAQKKLRG